MLLITQLTSLVNIKISLTFKHVYYGTGQQQVHALQALAMLLIHN